MIGFNPTAILHDVYLSTDHCRDYLTMLLVVRNDRLKLRIAIFSLTTMLESAKRRRQIELLAVGRGTSLAEHVL